MDIAQVKALPANTLLMPPGLIAVCTGVRDRKTGIGRRGEWSLQPIELKDDSGEIKAIVWDRPDVVNLKGLTVYLSALQTDRGWTGCSVEDNEYQGKIYKQIKLSGIFLLEPYSAPSDAPGAPQTNANGASHAEPSKVTQPLTIPDWDTYAALVREAHKLALFMEPDAPPTEGGMTPDRGRARAAIVNTILMAFGKRDFRFDPTDNGGIPF